VKTIEISLLTLMIKNFIFHVSAQGKILHDRYPEK